MTDREPILHLADAAAVEALLDELAGAIRPHLQATTALVGILRRGAPLAQLLAQRLEAAGGRAPEVGELALKRYSDDLTVLHDRPRLDKDSLDIGVHGRHLILVDDVLFTGESMFRAACHLRAAGATRLQTAVLCTRGRPTMPVRADFAGRRLDVGPGWVVDCAVPPYESALGITIRPVEAAGS